MGLYNKALIYHFADYGRDAEYGVNDVRITTIGYDVATGRILFLNDGGDFIWEYLPSSNLKSKLTYPNGSTASWTYEPTRDLLTSVTNRANGAVISAYDYTNDILGRRTVIGKSGTMMDENEVQPYTYNIRNELTSGQGYSYAYDDIGNRTEAEGRDYAANELNQYTTIDNFTPTYDLDGNQTKILTSTGEWVVEYNAENRPIRWTQGNIEIEMIYDRMGRRILYHETRDGSNYIYAKFVYNGYLCIQRLYGSSNGVYQSFVWDPTESVATRPLCMQVPSWGATTFYMHDGNKNVSDLIYYALANGIAAHYDYAPFGAVTRTARDTRMTQHTFIAENPFRFSSEYHDNTLGLVYYNYRHYNPKDGRWCGRDPIEDYQALYLFCGNSLSDMDILGLFGIGASVGDVIVNDHSGTLTGGGFAVDWHFMWSFDVSVEQSQEDPCVNNITGEISVNGEIGGTLGITKRFNKWANYEVIGLLGMRFFFGLKATMPVTVDYHKCDLFNAFSAAATGSVYGGAEGGALVRYIRKNKIGAEFNEIGAGVRGELVLGYDVAISCSGDSCELILGYGFQSATTTVFLNLPFMGWSMTFPSDISKDRYEISKSFANPLMKLIKR